MTEKQTSLKTAIKVLAIVQLILCLFVFVVNIFEGIIMLISTILLAVIVCYSSWMICILYIFLCMYDGFSCVLRVGELTASEGGLNSTFMILTWLTLLKVPFYVVSCYYVF
jgi:hypothetical protein